MNNFNTSPTNHAPVVCVHELVTQQATLFPDSIAISANDGTLTYRELDHRARQFAGLLGQLGIARGDAIGVCLFRGIDLVPVLLGIMKVGAAYVPLDPALPSLRLDHITSDAGLKLIITNKALVEILLPFQVQCLQIDEINLHEKYMQTAVLSDVCPEDLAYIIYTSGTTGKPKGVEVHHGALSNLLCAMRETPGFSRKDVMLAITTLSFDISGLELYLPLISGGRLELASIEVATDGRMLLAKIDQCRPTMMQATPATWRMLIQAGWEGTLGMVALCGGETLSRELANKLVDRTAVLWNMYGPTETTIWSTMARIESGRSEVSIGRPISNTSTYVLDTRMQSLPAGTAGELYIGGAGVAKGYRNLPDLSERKFVQDPFSGLPGAKLFRSGDQVRLAADGGLIHMGRLDSQVKIRGFRIELEEIQTTLARHPDIEQAVVNAFDNNLGDKQLSAYIVSRGDMPPAVENLKAFLRATLPEYMVPAFFVFLKQFPLTANNKIDTKALPVPSHESVSTQHSQHVPRNRLETQILAIWRQTLGFDELGIHDDFFDSGGNSLRAVQLLVQVEQIVGFRLPLDILFQVPTVARMADRISSEGWKPRQTSLVTIQKTGSKSPLFAIPGVGGNVLMFARLARLLGPEQPFFGLQARGVDNYEEPLESVSEIAQHYLSEIRSVQPGGPYFISGSCTGGIVAYEMAQQLMAGGEQVSLAILDSEHPSAYQHYVQFGSSFWRLGYIQSRGTALLRTLWNLQIRDWPNFLYRKLYLAVVGMRVGVNPGEERTEFQLRALYHRNMGTFARYKVARYPGSLLNVIATGRGIDATDTHQCWDALAAPDSRQVSIAADDSGQLFVSPHVEKLAQVLSEWLTENH